MITYNLLRVFLLDIYYYIVTYILERNEIKKADGQPLALHTLLSVC